MQRPAAIHKSENIFALHKYDNKFGMHKSENKFWLHTSEFFLRIFFELFKKLARNILNFHAFITDDLITQMSNCFPICSYVHSEGFYLFGHGIFFFESKEIGLFLRC